MNIKETIKKYVILAKKEPSFRNRNKAREYFKEHGIALSTLLRHMNFETHAQFLSFYNIQPLRRRNMSKRFLLNELRRFFNETGNIPTYELLQSSDDFPSSSTYVNRFGSFDIALRKAGFESNINFKKKTSTEEIKQCVLVWLKNNPKKKLSPTIFNMYNELPSLTTINKYFGNYHRFIKSINYKPDRTWFAWQNLCITIAQSIYGENKIKINKVDGIKGIVDIFVPEKNIVIDAMTRPYMSPQKLSEIKRYSANNRNLEFWCMEREGRKYKGVHYQYFNDLIKKVSDNVMKNEIIKRFSKIQVSYKQYSNDILLKHLKWLYQRLNRPIKSSDLLSDVVLESPYHIYPSPTTYVRYFGAFNKAVERAELEPKYKYYNEDELLVYYWNIWKKENRAPTWNRLNVLARKTNGPSCVPYIRRWKKIEVIKKLCIDKYS